ncbi:MAG: hypothetical protein R3B07_34595 [Polyangiaceae bacterium]
MFILTTWLTFLLVDHVATALHHLFAKRHALLALADDRVTGAPQDDAQRH